MKIGVAGPFSGPRAAFGDLLKLGVERARKEAEAAGTALEWVFADDVGLVEEAERAAQELLDSEVVAVIGHFNSACAKRVQPRYRAAGLPFLAPASTNADLTRHAGGWMLRCCPHDGQQADAVLRFVAEQGFRSLAVLADETFYGQSLIALFPEKWNGVSVRRLSDIAAEPVADADVVFFAGTHYNSATAVKSLREQGFAGVFVASDDSKIEEFLELAGDAGEGSYALGFEETYEESSYEAATLVWKTLNKFPQARGEELLRLLHQGAGPVAFTEQGERIGMEWSVWQGREGQFAKVR